MSESSAADRLAEADRTTAVVRRRSRWAVWSYIVTGTAGLVFAPIFAFPEHRLTFWLGMAAWVALSITSGAFARRRPVERRSFHVRSSGFHGVWFGAWLLLIGFGYTWFRGDLVFWLTGAVVTALIMYAGAFVEIREMRR